MVSLAVMAITPTSATGICNRQSGCDGSQMMRNAKQRGFTLLELMVVMVIAGIILGMISVTAVPGKKQHLEREAKRISSLLEVARDEAILRNLPVAIELDQFAYRFLIRSEQRWIPLKDDLLRERQYDISPLTLTLEPAPVQPGQFRIVFGREPVDKPFVLTLQSDAEKISIHADGIGHFYVDQ